MRTSPVYFIAMALCSSCASMAEVNGVGEALQSCDDRAINDVRIIGSHNSYRSLPPQTVLKAMEEWQPGLRSKLEYDHPSLTEQLDLGLRLLEIDFYIDPNGRYFAAPPNLNVLRNDDPRPVGPIGDGERVFRVMHIQGWDNYSSCASLSECVNELKIWHDKNPNHHPIFVTLNVKHDAPLPDSLNPIEFSAADLASIDQLLQETLGREHLLVPDDIRGNFETLREAVINKNWPKLSHARGKFVFILDEAKPHVSLVYREGAPSLRGRIMFGKYNEIDDEAAILSFWDIKENVTRARDLVSDGFIVRTGSDISTVEARTMDYTRFKRALQSGSQLIATDYYPGHPAVFETEYEVSFGDGQLIVCDTP